MFRIFRYLLWGGSRLILPLRYRWRVQGLETLRDIKAPVLVMPNHPAYIDPMLVYTVLYRKLTMRPMVFTGNFNNPIFWLVKKILDAHDLPDLDKASGQARAQAEQAIGALIEGLKQGQNHSLWPSGHTQHHGVERLGAARAAAAILRAVPEVTVILVRTHGLWGSSFSWAYTGKKPSLMRRFLAGAGLLLANLIFFMPRRRVEITVRRVERSELPPLTREDLNPWLEKWYNEGNSPAPVFVPYHFLFGPRSHKYPEVIVGEEVDLDRIKPATIEAVGQILADRLQRPLSDKEQSPDTSLDELGLDSIDRMEVALQVERQFGVTADETPATVGQLWMMAEGLAEKAPPKPPPARWFRVPAETKPAILGDTISAAFVARALANPKDVAVADDLSGVLTYERLLVAVLIMSRRLVKLPGENVGLLLPSSVGGDIALLALLMAGKLPVLLNWTTGPASLAHAAKVMKLTHVVTSKAFIDRTGIEVAGTQYVYLEDLRRSMGFFKKLRTLLGVKLFPGRVGAKVPQLSPDQPAVVLFTSGSEKAPKAVPLTHNNILTDQRLGLPFMELTRQDAFLSFLPAFHSFGLTVTGLLPLLGGIRAVRHPDPTDAANLARKIIAYKATVLIATPTFIAHVLERAQPGEMDSLKLIVAGAEKCPQSVFDLCHRIAPNARVVEGYGVTECAPVVSVNPPSKPKPGSIGTPFPGVEVRVVDLESGRPLPVGQMGMIQVSGPTVFPGYIAYEGPSPFVEDEGKRWYVTGDLGEFDSDGYLWFRGRLKRFLKAAGEMISLLALEEPFAQLYPPTEDGPSVAVEGVEFDHGRRIVLFTTKPLSLRDANALLMEKGFHGVMRLDEVRQVEKIPTLGTGKTDYKVLRKQIEESLQRQHEAG